MSTSTSTSSSKPRLWISPGTCSLAPHTLLIETGLPYDLVSLDITKVGSYLAEHKHINPKGRVPVLELDGEIITETTAVMTAISQLSPSSHLFGRTNMDAVRVYEWFNWLSGTLHERGFGAMFTPKNYSDDASAHAGISLKSREWVGKCFGMIDEKLAGKEHAVNNVFTAADVFLWVMYRWGYLIQIDMEGDYPNYTRVVNKVIQREAVKAAAQKEGIPLIKDNRLGEGISDNFERNQNTREE